MAQAEFELLAGGSREVTLKLERWVDAAAEGWFSGENHIHANYGYGQWYNSPRTMLRQCAGEGIGICNFMVSNSDTDGIFDRGDLLAGHRAGERRRFDGRLYGADIDIHRSWPQIPKLQLHSNGRRQKGITIFDVRQVGTDQRG